MIKEIFEWLEVFWELCTMWGKSLMNNDEGNPTAEVMAGEEGNRN